MIGRILLSLGAACFCVVLLLAIPPVLNQPEAFRISDFVYHLIIFRSAWFGETHSIYLFPDQLEALNNFAAPEMQAAMPVGISPTGYLLAIPFYLLFPLGLVGLQFLWLWPALSLFIIQITEMAARSTRFERLLILVGTILCLILTLTGITTFSLGQSSLMATALLLWLIRLKKKPSAPHEMLICVCLLLLSVKLPYLVLGIVVLVSKKFFRTLGLGVTGVLICFFVSLFSLQGLETAFEFFRSLQIYSASEIPAHYASSVVIALSSTARNVWTEVFGKQYALLASSIGACALVCIFLLNMVRERFFSKKLDAYPFALGVYLLFSPYAVANEDLLLLTLVPYWLSDSYLGYSRVSRCLDVFLVFLVLNQNLIPIFQHFHLVPWLCKAYVLYRVNRVISGVQLLPVKRQPDFADTALQSSP